MFMMMNILQTLLLLVIWLLQPQQAYAENIFQKFMMMKNNKNNKISDSSSTIVLTEEQQKQEMKTICDPCICPATNDNEDVKMQLTSVTKKYDESIVDNIRLNNEIIQLKTQLLEQQERVIDSTNKMIALQQQQQESEDATNNNNNLVMELKNTIQLRDSEIKQLQNDILIMQEHNKQRMEQTINDIEQMYNEKIQRYETSVTAEMKQLNERLLDSYSRLQQQQQQQLSQDTIASTSSTGSSNTIDTKECDTIQRLYDALLIKYENVLTDRKEQLQLYLKEQLEIEANKKCIHTIESNEIKYTQEMELYKNQIGSVTQQLDATTNEYTVLNQTYNIYKETTSTAMERLMNQYDTTIMELEGAIKDYETKVMEQNHTCAFNTEQLQKQWMDTNATCQNKIQTLNDAYQQCHATLDQTQIQYKIEKETLTTNHEIIVLNLTNHYQNEMKQVNHAFQQTMQEQNLLLQKQKNDELNQRIVLEETIQNTTKQLQEIQLHYQHSIQETMVWKELYTTRSYFNGTYILTDLYNRTRYTLKHYENHVIVPFVVHTMETCQDYGLNIIHIIMTSMEHYYQQLFPPSFSLNHMDTIPLMIQQQLEKQYYYTNYIRPYWNQSIVHSQEYIHWFYNDVILHYSKVYYQSVWYNDYIRPVRVYVQKEWTTMTVPYLFQLQHEWNTIYLPMLDEQCYEYLYQLSDHYHTIVCPKLHSLLVPFPTMPTTTVPTDDTSSSITIRVLSFMSTGWESTCANVETSMKTMIVWLKLIPCFFLLFFTRTIVYWFLIQPILIIVKVLWYLVSFQWVWDSLCALYNTILKPKQQQQQHNDSATPPTTTTMTTKSPSWDTTTNVVDAVQQPLSNKQPKTNTTNDNIGNNNNGTTTPAATTTANATTIMNTIGTPPLLPNSP